MRQGGPSMATKSAMDGPAGPVVAGDHLRRDRTTSEVPKLLIDVPQAASQRLITRYFNDVRASHFKTGQPVLKWADRF